MYTGFDMIMEVMPIIVVVGIFLAIMAWADYLVQQDPTPLLYDIIDIINNVTIPCKKNPDKVVYHKGDWA